jgi:hypothetical protein
LKVSGNTAIGFRGMLFLPVKLKLVVKKALLADSRQDGFGMLHKYLTAIAGA